MLRSRFNYTMLVIALFAVFAFSACLSDGSDEDNNGNADGDTATADGDNTVPADGDNTTTPPADGDVTEKSDSTGPVIIPGDKDDEEDDGRNQCTVDTDCGKGDQWCDNGICKIRKRICEACNKHEECGYTDDLCLPSGMCGRRCDAKFLCDDDFICTYFDELKSSQCTFNAVDSPRGGPCCGHAHCATPYVCNPTSSKCGEGCCSEGACSTSSSMNCPKGVNGVKQVCFDEPGDGRDGYCKPGCDTSADCLGGEVCVEQECKVGDCGSKQDCPMEHICNISELTCIQGCEDDKDCRAHNECLEKDGQKTCVKRIGCEGTFLCSIGENCTKEDAPKDDRGCCYDPRYPQTGECKDPNDKQTCCKNPEETKKYCMPCTGETEGECGANSYCLEFKDPETEESLGKFCGIARNCTAQTEDGKDEGDQECPRGYDCGLVEGDGVKQKVCYGSCWQDRFKWPDDL